MHKMLRNMDSKGVLHTEKIRLIHLCWPVWSGGFSRGAFQLAAGAGARTGAPGALIPGAPAASKSPICPALWQRARSLVKMAQISVHSLWHYIWEIKTGYGGPSETAPPQMK